ncbi:MAG: hypothetical protein K9M15_01655 [Candidatus Marinimicrobia bacterium]|nr:hypothetical protein [Candidatus Neomarinimicrobiota bacterium]
MKWFQHQSESLINLKLQEFIDEFGMEGYGFWWRTCELVANQGKNYRIKETKKWKKALKIFSKLPEEKIESMLKQMATLNMICKKSLDKGVLAVPKMAEYSDEYTKKVRRVSVQGTDNVRQDKIRRDKIRREESTPPKKDFSKSSNVDEVLETDYITKSNKKN